MKTRNALVSNSSSTSFIIRTKKIKDEELYEALMSTINDGTCYIAPEFDNKSSLHVSTGQSQSNGCLYKWWEIKKWLEDNHIDHDDQGDGCPEPEQKVCDFVAYMTEDNNSDQPDPEKVKKIRAWVGGIVDTELDRAAKTVGLTRDDVIKDMKDGDPGMVENYIDLLVDKADA